MNEEQKQPQQIEMFQELILSVAPAAAETVQAIADIPAQLELLSRATLARSFIRQVDESAMLPDGISGGQVKAHYKGYIFDVERFEKAWAYLAPTYETADNEPETDAQTP